MARILVSVLSWGLGHSTRSSALIRELLARGHEIVLLAHGRAREFLQKEFPALMMYDLRDYTVPFPKRRFFALKFVLSSPKLILEIKKEEKAFRRLVRKIKPDLIVSDERFNIHSFSVPSFIISHQLRFIAPPLLRPAELLLEWFNRHYFKKFNYVIVPDFADNVVNMSGRLSHGLYLFDRKEIFYAGPFVDLASSRGKAGPRLPRKIGCFISISGPEPQRTVFERIVMSQLSRKEVAAALESMTSGPVVVSLGKPESSGFRRMHGNVLIYDFLDRKGQLAAMKRASVVVSRSGYTTMMEIAALGKKALLVPTIGQTEQEHLSEIYAERGWFYSVSQYRLDLVRDVKKALKKPGFPFMPDMVKNAQKVCDLVESFLRR